MRLRTKFIVYLVLLHLFVGVLTVLLVGRVGLWFLAIEAGFVLSLVYGYGLVRRLVEPLEFLNSGADFLKEEEFSTRFREVGQAEMDHLIGVYNAMLSRLQQEHLALGERRGFLEKLLEATPAGILTFDFDGRISSVNRAAQQLLAASADDLIGRRLAGLGHPLAAELRALAPGESRLVPLRGGQRLRCMCSQFIDRGFNRSFILIEELTEELRLSEKAAYEKLIRMMSHEVNNTVGSTNSLLDSCLNYAAQIAPADRLEFTEALGVVISRNESLNAFVRQFANVVRLPDPVPQAVDLQALLERVALLTGAQCRDRDIVWIWDIPGPAPQVALDEPLMEQALLNIVRNAIEAIDRSGTITVRLITEADGLSMSVIDSGGGLTSEAQRQVFTPFFTSKKDGQGIGLTVVREVLTRHGFAFSLGSTAPGGACFNVRFPSRALIR